MISKPPVGALVNRADPLAAGLVGAWLFNEGAGKRIGDSAGSRSSASALATSGLGWLGGAGNFPGSQWAAVPAGVWTPQKTSPFSIFVRVKYTQTGNGTMLGLGYPTTPGIVLRTQSAAGPYVAGNILFVMSNAAGNNSISCSSSKAFNDGKWHNVIALYDGTASATSMSLVVDGSVVTLSTQGLGGTGDPGTLGDIGFRLGARMDGGETFVGGIDKEAVWSRLLTVREAIEITTNPWRMFEPTSQRRRYVAGASPVTGSITTSQAQTIAGSETETFSGDAATAQGQGTTGTGAIEQRPIGSGGGHPRYIQLARPLSARPSAYTQTAIVGNAQTGQGAGEVNGTSSLIYAGWTALMQDGGSTQGAGLVDNRIPRNRVKARIAAALLMA